MTDAKLPASAEVDELVIEEPAGPHRIRRPIDLVRFALAVVAAVLSLLVARFAVNTAAGIGEDITGVAPLVPQLLLTAFSFFLGLGAVVFPIALGVDAILRDRVRDFFEGLVAAVAAGVLAWLVHVWLHRVAPPEMLAALVRGTKGGGTTQATQPVVASLVALFTVAGVGSRESVQRATWGLLGAGLFFALVAGVATPTSMVLTIAIGRAVGTAVRYALGITSLRPNGRHIADTLDRFGFRLTRLTWVEDPSARPFRRYQACTTSGRRLELQVFDRDQQGTGILYRSWRRVRLRETVLRRESVSMRQSIERQSLLAYAAQRAGAATPPLLLAAEVGSEAAVLTYEAWEGQALDQLDGDVIRDADLTSAWNQLRHLRAHAITHRNLTPSSLMVGPTGGVWLRPLALGEVAASELQLRLDVAELLCTLGAAVGPARAVETGIAVLGERELLGAVPLLQPIALSSETRAAVRANPTLLNDLRGRILAQTQEEAQEPARLERVRPRTVLTLIAGTIGAYFLLSQLAQIDATRLVSEARWGWAGIALVGSAATYVASALALLAFAPVTLSFESTLLAQVAASFAALVTPPAVGGVAVNVRFVQKSGAPPSLAVASVGVSQAAAFVIHLVLLAVAGYYTGSRTGADLVPNSREIVAVVGGAAVVAIVLLLPVARRAVVRRIRPLMRQVVPRLLEVVQEPRRLILGLVGNLMLNFGYVVAFYAAIQAFGGDIAFWSAAVVYLAGSAVGSAVPTPGGLGAVEAALAGGLTAAGVSGDIAVSAVLLYRLATFWLPVAPGYLAFGWLQRRNLL